MQRFSANGAFVAYFHFCDIDERFGLNIARDVHAFHVVQRFVCAGNHIVRAFQRLIENDDSVFQVKPDWPDISRDEPRFFVGFPRDDVFHNRFFEFGFVDFQIAPDKRDDNRLFALHGVNDRLYRLIRLNFQKLRNFRDVFGVAGENFFLFRVRAEIDLGTYARRDFHIRLVSALVAKHERVFADFCQQHKLVSDTAAHHTAVRLDRDEFFQPDTAEYVVVCVVFLVIMLFKVLLSHMERVRVFHREFPDADKSAAATRLVTKLRLNLINHERKLIIARNGVFCKVYRRFFVRHSEKHIFAASVLKPHHLAADA